MGNGFVGSVCVGGCRDLEVGDDADEGVGWRFNWGGGLIVLVILGGEGGGEMGRWGDGEIGAFLHFWK